MESYAIGTHYFRMTLDDDAGNEAYITNYITVVADNDAPVITDQAKLTRSGSPNIIVYIDDDTVDRSGFDDSDSFISFAWQFDDVNDMTYVIYESTTGAFVNTINTRFI